MKLSFISSILVFLSFCVSCERQAVKKTKKFSLSLQGFQNLLPISGSDPLHSLSLSRHHDADYIELTKSGKDVGRLYIDHKNLSMTVYGIGRAETPTRLNTGLSYRWQLNELDNYASYGEVLREAEVVLTRKNDQCTLDYKFFKSAGTVTLVDAVGTVTLSCLR